MKYAILKAMLLIVFLACYHGPDAQENSVRRAEIIELEGKAEAKTAGTDIWNPLAAGMEIKSGDLVRTEAGSYVDMGIEETGIRNAIVRIYGDSLVATNISSSDIIVNIDSGKIVFWAEKTGSQLRKFEVRTPNAILGIEGSHGIVDYNQQIDITNSRIDTRGGYFINPNTGEGGSLDKGTNYVQSEKMKIEKKKKIPEIHYWDFTSFHGNYAFAMRGMRRFETALSNYNKDYFSGYYKTLIGVIEGTVAVAPYDEDGPKLYEQVMVNAGQQIYMEDRILVDVEYGSGDKRQKPEESKKDADSEKKEDEKEGLEVDSTSKIEAKEEVALQLDDTLGESQEAVP